MDEHNELRRRDSLRLPSWDYASEAWYYVTICTHRRELLFGYVMDERMQLSALGEIVDGCWKWLEDQYANTSLDEYIIMPNHLHGVIALHQGRRGGSRTAPTQIGKPLGSLIGAFKTISTKRINQQRNSPGTPVWQRGFYDPRLRGANGMSFEIKPI